MNSTRQLLRIQCLGSLTSSVFRVPGQRTVLPRAGIEHDSRHCLCNCQGLKLFHGSARFAKSKSSQTEVDWRVDHDGEKKDKSLVAQDNLFERVGKDTKTKATFNKAVDVFIKRDIRRRGHVEFIYAALRKMPEFGVARDITVYNKLLDVFPKEVFVPRNFIQRMFNHYPRQQECGVQLLEQMESYGVMPNMETKVLLVQIFGEKGHPMRKFQRIMYWFPKFKHANPFPVPLELTTDPVELSRFSLTRIANDLDARVTVYQYPLTDISETGEEISQPHVIGIQSPEQRLLLAKHNPSRPVFVEGPFPLWLRKTCVHYYVLRAEAPPPEEEVEEEFDLELCSPHQSLFFPRWVDLDLNRDLGDDHSFDVDDLTDGPVYAMCMTGQGDQVTLAKWISGLQKTNPILGEIPTLFRLDSGSRELQATADAQKGPGQEQEQEPEKELEQDTEPESDRRDVHSVKQ